MEERVPGVRCQGLGAADWGRKGQGQRTGNREQGIGTREQGTGKREQGTGNREPGPGNSELVRPFFGSDHRVVHVGGSSAGRTSGRHSRLRQDVAWDLQRMNLVTSKISEQYGNVSENKGPLWKTQGRGWNVYENTDT